RGGCPWSPVSPPDDLPGARWPRARRWRSRRAASCPRAPTPWCPSSSSATRARPSTCRRPRRRARTSGPAAGMSALATSRLAALASSGVVTLRCAARPTVAIVSTGTELRRPGETLREGEIYESNGLMLAALLAGAGAIVRPPEHVEDDPRAHEEALARGLEADVLVSSGGVSVGPHDLVRDTLGRLGVEEALWGVAMRPGKPLSFGARNGTLVFGLPGNPVSSLVGALLFLLPALRALEGRLHPEPPFATGSLAAPASRRPSRDDFQRASLERTADGVTLRTLSGQDSHMIA